MSNTQDSLRHSHARINAYKALSSPSLIALSSRDPLLTAFELSWELRRLSTMESEFRNEYNVSCKIKLINLFSILLCGYRKKNVLRGRLENDIKTINLFINFLQRSNIFMLLYISVVVLIICYCLSICSKVT